MTLLKGLTGDDPNKFHDSEIKQDQTKKFPQICVDEIEAHRTFEGPTYGTVSFKS